MLSDFLSIYLLIIKINIVYLNNVICKILDNFIKIINVHVASIPMYIVYGVPTDYRKFHYLSKYVKFYTLIILSINHTIF